MKRSLLIIFSFLTIGILQATNYGPYKQFVDMNFETAGVLDNLNNTSALLQNGATVVMDSERNSNVVQFTAEQKGNLRFMTSPLNDTITIAFWYKREAIDPQENWRMMFAFYAADGSNLFFTPKTSWGEGAFMIYDLKPFSVYSTLSGAPVVNNKWEHYAIQFEGNNMKLYQNGSMVATSKLLTKLSDIKSVKWFFGCNPELNFPMTGKLDDLKIFHSILAPNQIKALHERKDLPPAIDEAKPFVHLPLDFDAIDINGSVATTATNITFTSDAKAGKVASFGADSRISFTTNPFGAFKYSLAMMFKKDDLSTDNEKYIFKAKSANNDFVGMRLKVVNNSSTIEVVEFKDNALSVLGTTSASNLLNSGTWNSVVFVQTFGTSGTPAIRIYINGISALVKANVNLHTYNFTNWYIGSDDANNVAAKYDEIRIFQREISSIEVAGYFSSQTNSVNLTADYGQKIQTIRNFGSSDAWNTQNVGLYFSESQKEELAELLFSTDKFADGTPKGIGLSAWRFNIGAGTAEQGASSRITTEERRSEGFLNADGTYNWNKQAGQRWFLEKAAKTYKVPDIIGWQNSPPVQYTVRGLGFREFGDAKKSILKTDKYSDFGKFLADVVLHFKQEGINFNYISPLNEPQHDWSATTAGGNVSQEGSPWTNTEISNVTKAIDAQFIAKGVQAKLLIGEAGSINNLVSGTGVAQNQLTNLWSSSSSIKISNVPSVANIVNAHSYFTDTSADVLINNRNTVKTRMNSEFSNYEYWQTEYSLLNNGYKFGFPTDRNVTPMESGIALARMIHADLTVVNATGWQWWTTFEWVKNLSSEDRFALIQVALNTSKTEGLYATTKLLYTLGNYSYFLRPGTKRLNVKRSDNMSDVNAVANLMVSAYINENSNELIYVVINPTNTERGINLLVDNLPENTHVSEFTPYITSDKATDNIKKYPSFDASERFTLPATSVVTFVGKIKNNTSTSVLDQESLFEFYPNPCSDILNVKLNKNQTGQRLRISDITGKVIMNKDIVSDESNIQLSLSNLQKGIFFITLNSNGDVHTKMFVKN